MAEMRLIDANALPTTEVLTIRRSYRDARKTVREYKTVVTAESIAHAPTIDAVPVVHARWVHEQRYGDSGGWVWRCSACRRESITCIISAMKYCHACGAKMDGGAADG